MKYNIGILWLRNDLRLHDNEALCKAIEQSQAILPVYCIDPRQEEMTEYGFKKSGTYRERFLWQSLLDLQSQLQAKGCDLAVLRGKPEEVLPTLAGEIGAGCVFAHKESAPEERKVEEAVEAQLFKNGVNLTLYWGSTLYHVEDLPMPVVAIPEVFTQFRKQVEKYVQVREPWPIPAQIPTVHYTESEKLIEVEAGHRDARFMHFTGGESAGLARLRAYLWDKDLIRTYKETRNGLLGADYSSKLSPWLALGCLSPRLIYQEIRQYEQERVKNSSTYWLIFELIWRDFFRFISHKHGKLLFLPGGIKQKPRTWQNNQKHLQAWIEGKTGIPFIDANMRELAATGFMSNRGRQNVASFLVHDLQIDWRLGAAYFESMLIDYDVASNWGNWNYVAGVGNDPRQNRYFNILSQAKRYDPQGDYIRAWIPELAALPSNMIHDPGHAYPRELADYGISLGSTYPFPIVEFRGGAVPA